MKFEKRTNQNKSNEIQNNLKQKPNRFKIEAKSNQNRISI